MEAANILDAASQGASTAIMLVLNIGASLVAFLAFVEFVNQIISKHVSYFKHKCLKIVLQLNLHFFESATANLFLYFRIICFFKHSSLLCSPTGK